MMLVESIDLETGTATFDLGDRAEGAAAACRPLVVEAARALGVHVFRLRGPGGSVMETALARDAGGAAGGRWPLLAHEASRTQAGARYRASIAHRPDAFRGILAYTELVLGTSGAPAADIGTLRLVTYELCVNAVEHGRPLVEAPTLEIGFEIGARAIAGWVRDACAAFDPVGFQSQAVARLVRGHARRGYGLRIVKRVVDSVAHAHDGRGNLVTFTKEHAHEAAT